MINRAAAVIQIIALSVLLQLAAERSCAEAVPASKLIRKIRHYSGPDQTRIVLDLNKPCYYQVSERKDPDRIVIDIPSGRFSSSVKMIRVGDGLLTRIRVNKLRKGAQVVLDLPRVPEYKYYTLGPNAVHPDRIVIDLKRSITKGERMKRKAKAEKVANSGDIVVIIDPGHGGSKPGTSSRSGLLEKTVALDISRMIKAAIDSYEGFRAVLTRSGDYDVNLADRIKIARSHGGRCFVSIHLNGAPSSKPRGAEIYYLSVEGARDENSVALEERENMILEMGEEGEVLNDDIEWILGDWGRKEAMSQSFALSKSIADKLKGVRSIPFRGIKQGNFVILRNLQKPSVLVEVAFLTNKKDVALMRKDRVKKEYSKAIASGIVEYLLENPPEGSGISPAKMLTHTVSRGETLGLIAQRYGITIREICDLNGIRRSSTIRPGQKLRVIRKTIRSTGS